MRSAEDRADARASRSSQFGEPEAAAAAYYPKPFAATATKTTFNGYEAVKTGNVYLLFTKVAAPPQNELTGPQTAVWHFGWNTPDSRKYNERFRAMGLEIAQMWDAADGKLVDMSSDTLPGLADAGTDSRDARQGRAADAAGRLRLSPRTRRHHDRERAGGRGRALQSHPHVPRASALRDAVVRHASRRDAAAGSRRGAGAAAVRRLQAAVRAADVAVVREVSRLRPRPVRRRAFSTIFRSPSGRGQAAVWSARAGTSSITGR